MSLLAPLTSFVGREKEADALRRLLQTTRLVTLTGPGGVGKTRLALHVAASLLDTFADGVRLVELAALSDAVRLPFAVASQLGVADAPGQSDAEALTGALRGRRMLVILDNCEHLVEACARWVDGVLRACPMLSILVTSREPLGIQGEQLWSVQPLDVPNARWAEGLTLHPRLIGSASVQLFVERAAALQPDFALTAENAVAVVRICRQLDGLPLAIELAAGRVPILFPGGIAARLDHPLRLLTGGSRAAPPRQQTLRATLDWSYSLLTPAERTLFRRTSVFASGWTLAAAEMVCAGGRPGRDNAGDEGDLPDPDADDIQPGDVLDLLARLVDKSLVVAEEQGGEGRFRLLETMRQYAAEKLQTTGEAGRLHRRHHDWCMDLALRFEVEWRGPDQVAWFARLEREHDNLRAALTWSLAMAGAGDSASVSPVDAGLRLGGALWHFWEVRGYLSEGRSWLAGLLALPTPGQDTPARAKALDGAGHLAVLQGDQAVGVPLLLQSLALCRALADKRGSAQALHSLGLAAQYQGDHASAMARHQESLVLAREVDDRVGIYLAIYNLAVVAQEHGDYARAVALHEESLVLKRAQGDPWSIAFSLQNLGLLAWRQEQVERAVALLQQSLRLRWALQGEVGIAMCLEVLAEIAATRGQAERSARLRGAAEAMLETTGVTLMRGLVTRFAPEETVARTSLDPEVYARALGQGRAMLTEQAVEYALASDTSPEPVGPTGSSAPGDVVPRLLTRRERDVAELVGRGLTNRQIAAELVISTWTASTHVRNILGKLGIARRAQLAAWTVEHNSDRLR